MWQEQSDKNPKEKGISEQIVSIYYAVVESEREISDGQGRDAWEGLASLRKKYDI